CHLRQQTFHIIGGRRRRFSLACTRLAARRTLPPTDQDDDPDDRGSDSDLDSAIPVERAEHWRRQYTRPLPVRRCLCYALAGALAVWASPTRAPLPRAALNRGGAAREDLRECRRPTTRSGKLRRPSGVTLMRRRWRRSSMNCWTCPATRASGTRLKS